MCYGYLFYLCSDSVVRMERLVIEGAFDFRIGEVLCPSARPYGYPIPDINNCPVFEAGRKGGPLCLTTIQSSNLFEHHQSQDRFFISSVLTQSILL